MGGLNRCGTVISLIMLKLPGAESIGVEERGGYYDGSGAMRDMFQNHLLQVSSHGCHGTARNHQC